MVRNGPEVLQGPREPIYERARRILKTEKTTFLEGYGLEGEKATLGYDFKSGKRYLVTLMQSERADEHHVEIGDRGGIVAYSYFFGESDNPLHQKVFTIMGDMQSAEAYVPNEHKGIDEEDEARIHQALDLIEEDIERQRSGQA